MALIAVIGPGIIFKAPTVTLLVKLYSKRLFPTHSLLLDCASLWKFIFLWNTSQRNKTHIEISDFKHRNEHFILHILYAIFLRIYYVRVVHFRVFKCRKNT